MPSLSSGCVVTRYPSACSYPSTNRRSGRSPTILPIHLKPVNVSALCTPCASAIFDSSDDDTNVVTTSRSSPAVWPGCDRRTATRSRRRSTVATTRRAAGSPRRADRHPGRWPTRPSASDVGATSSSRSIAPGSSGLGNATVGNVPSGSCWAATTTGGSGKPAACERPLDDGPADTVHRRVGHRDVVDAGPQSHRGTRSTYASTSAWSRYSISGSSSAASTTSRGSNVSMRSAMSVSTGVTICEPVDRNTL